MNPDERSKLNEPGKIDLKELLKLIEARVGMDLNEWPMHKCAESKKLNLEGLQLLEEKNWMEKHPVIVNIIVAIISASITWLCMRFG